jgi:oligopeptide/dipeptide ABC transporter ATP-binding protein
VTIQAQIIELVKRLRDELGMAIIWITHDLGIIAGLADRVMVMYGGLVVEEVPVVELYTNPQHPYTIALLSSLPRVDEMGHRRLASIDGASGPWWPVQVSLAHRRCAATTEDSVIGYSPLLPCISRSVFYRNFWIGW